MKVPQFNTDIKKGRKETRKNQRQKYAVRFEAKGRKQTRKSQRQKFAVRFEAKGRKETRKNQRHKYAVRFEALEILCQARRDAELCPSVTEILKQNLFAKVEKKSKKQTVMKQTQKSLVDRLKAFGAAKKNERRIENLIEKVTTLSTKDMNEDIDEITKTMVSSMVLNEVKDSEMINQEAVSALSKLSLHHPNQEFCKRAG